LSVDEKLVVDESVPDADVGGPGPVAPDGLESAAVLRFRSCRWRKSAENGTPECCGHRDVLPLTGTNGFDPEAWCPDCSFYKLRRTPKKRDDFGARY
jgi:hypothetical protein